MIQDSTIIRLHESLADKWPATRSKRVAGDNKAETAGVATTATGSSEVKTAIMGSNSAIGYLGFSYMQGSKIAAIALDGVSPDLQSIRDGSYKLQRHLYLYTLGESASCTKAFIDFVISAEGQKIAEENGFIPI